MRIPAWVALLSLALTVAGCGGDDETKSSVAAKRAPGAIHVDEGRFLGFLWPPGGAGEIQLAKLDPLTLAPESRPLALDALGGVTEVSPDGSTLALGAGEAPRVEFLDLNKMRSLGTVDLGTAGYVSRLSWSSGMLFAAVGQSAVAVVHPNAQQLVETRRVGGLFVGDIQAIPAGLLALVGPAERIGPLKVVVFGGKGTTSVPLRGMVGGWEIEGDEADYRSRGIQPGLTVDPSGRRALVVSAGDRVAEVNLANLRVTYHSLSRPVSLLGRLRNWLEPAAEAKIIEGPTRQAVWLSSGLVAVTGVDYTTSGDEDALESTAEPAGLSLIDTRNWSVRTINESIDWVRVAGERLLAFEPGCAGDQVSYGLVAYDLEGKEIFNLCRNEGFDPQVVGRYAYLGFGDNTRFEIVDLTTGKVVARARTAKTTSLLSND